MRHGHQVWAPGLLLNLLCLSQRSPGCLGCLSGLPSLPSLSPYLLLSSHSVTSHSFLVAISDIDCCSSVTSLPLVSHSQMTLLLTWPSSCMHSRGMGGWNESIDCGVEQGPHWVLQEAKPPVVNPPSLGRTGKITLALQNWAPSPHNGDKLGWTGCEAISG